MKCVLCIAAAVVIAIVAAAALIQYMMNPDLTNLTGKKLICFANINVILGVT